MAEILDEVNQHRPSMSLSVPTLTSAGRRLSDALERRLSATPPVQFTRLTENKDAAEENADNIAMHEMGYEQELHRGFSGLMAFTFCFTVVSVLPSLSIGLDFALNTGGSGMIIWSWIVGSFFNIMIGLSLGEICSTYPNSGSVYYWSGVLSPAKYMPIASYICGWFSFFGIVGATAAFASGFASIVNAAVVLANSTQVATSQYGLNDVPHTFSLNNNIQTAIAIGVLLLWALQNILRIDQQGWINNLAAFIQIVGTITIIITILAVAKQRASAYTVFFSTINQTGFSFGYICLIGILPTLFSFSGFDAASHLCEEIRNAEKFAPIGILGTCVCAAVVGLAYLLALMYASYDPLDLVQTTLNPSATVQIYEISTPLPVALAFTIVLIITLYFAGMSATTTASRTGYTMARDNLLPGSRWLRSVHKRTQTPIFSVLLVFVINVLLLLLNLVSSIAFAAIVSISTIGFQISYMLPILFRITHSRKTFRRGKFHLGRYSVAIGILSSVWLLTTSIILLFPYNYPITAQNFNWTVVVICGIAIIAAVYWIFAARHKFTGPKRMDQAEKDSEATPVAIPVVITDDFMVTHL